MAEISKYTIGGFLFIAVICFVIFIVLLVSLIKHIKIYQKEKEKLRRKKKTQFDAVKWSKKKQKLIFGMITSLVATIVFAIFPFIMKSM